jgi:ubiquitin carboxyl-terminal hydrolase 47
MNSLLQALYMTPDFRRMIYKWNYDAAINPAKKDCIIYQLQKLFATLQAGKQPFGLTNDLTGSFQWDYS